VSIYVDEGVLKKAGIVLSEETRKSFEQSVEGMATSQKPGEGRLDILSEAVQHILARCEAEAKGLDCSYICTGHLFLALVKESNKVTKVIENAGVSLERIRRDVEWSMKVEQDIEGGGVGLTPTVKGVIEASITDAKRLGSEEVLPEHVLLGLVRYPNGIAAIQLMKSGITLETVYVELIRLYSGNRSSLGLSS
jgi:ATP-dependent Clp protease ATP-binding subunit ClpC